jgi:FMN phosphatase YigB (HAD superfamily)
MASAVEELEGTGVEITKATSLLIDDDGKNVRTALRDGVRAIWLNPDQSERLLSDIARLV